MMRSFPRFFFLFLGVAVSLLFAGPPDSVSAADSSSSSGAFGAPGEGDPPGGGGGPTGPGGGGTNWGDSHNECAGQQCITISGAGVNQCFTSADCQDDDDPVIEYTKCVKNPATGEGLCQVFTHDGSDGSPPPENACLTDDQCNDWVCSLDVQSTSQPAPEASPAPTPSTGGPVCRKVFGTGQRLCTSEQDCTHTECVEDAASGLPLCQLFPTPGEDQCVSTGLTPKNTGPVMLDLGLRDSPSAVAPYQWHALPYFLQTLQAKAQNQGSGILGIGVAPDNAVYLESASPPWGGPFSTAEGSAISFVDFNGYQVVAISTLEDDLYYYGVINGGISLEEVALLQPRKCEVQRFVNDGGALLSLSLSDCTQVQPGSPDLAAAWDQGHYAWLLGDDAPVTVSVSDPAAGQSPNESPLSWTPQLCAAGFCASLFAGPQLVAEGDHFVAFESSSIPPPFEVWMKDADDNIVTIGKPAGKGVLGQSCIAPGAECAYLYSACGNGVIEEGEECDYGQAAGEELSCQFTGAAWQCCGAQCRWEDAPPGYCGEAMWVVAGQDGNDDPVIFANFDQAPSWRLQTLLPPAGKPLKQGPLKDARFGLSPNYSTAALAYRPYWEALGTDGKIIATLEPDLQTNSFWQQVPNTLIPKFFKNKKITAVAHGPDPAASGFYKWMAVGCKGRMLVAHLKPDQDNPGAFAWEFFGDGPKWFEDMANSPNDNGLTDISSGFFSACIRGVAHNGQPHPTTIWVAVGDGGRMAISADGSVWDGLSATGFGASAIHGVAHAGTTFVAVGEQGKIGWSPTGLDNSWTVAAYEAWTFRAVGCSPFGLQGATPLCVAAGDNATLYTSSDAGRSWIKRVVDGLSSVSIRDVAHNGLAGELARWTAVTADGHLATSQDGIAWSVTEQLTTLIQEAPVPVFLDSVAYKPQVCE